MKLTKEQLTQQAVVLGICAQGQETMREAAGISGLIDYYIANPDWCMERDFPDYTTLMEYAEELAQRGIYVGKEFKGELLNKHQVYIFHRCKGKIKVALNEDEAMIPMFYVGNGCRLRFVGEPATEDERKLALQPIDVPIYIFGKNDVAARDNKFAKFRTYKFLMKR